MLHRRLRDRPVSLFLLQASLSMGTAAILSGLCGKNSVLREALYRYLSGSKKRNGAHNDIWHSCDTKVNGCDSLLTVLVSIPFILRDD